MLPTKEQVSRGKRLAQQEGDAKWALGDLALEIAPMGDDGVRTGAYAHLENLAAQIGVDYETLRQYRKVSAAFPAGPAGPGEIHREPTSSWTAHRHLMSHPDLMRPRMTVTEASNALGHKNRAREPLAQRDRPEERARRIQQDLDDPEVRKIIVETPKLRRQIDTNIEQIQEEQHRRAKGKSPRPVRGGLGGIELFVLNSEIRDARKTIAEVLKKLPGVEMTDEYREIMGGEIEKLIDVTDWLKSYVQSGQRDFDDALAELLKD